MIERTDSFLTDIVISRAKQPQPTSGGWYYGRRKEPGHEVQCFAVFEEDLVEGTLWVNDFETLDGFDWFGPVPALREINDGEAR